MGCYPICVLNQGGVFGTGIELRDSNKTVRYTGSPEEIESQCEALDALDKQTEARKTAMVVAAVLGGIVGFGGVIGDLWALAIPAFVVSAAALVYYASINNNDIEDRKLLSAREILETLKPELKNGRPAQLDIDFRLYDNARTNGVWMTLATTLEDGTGLKLDISTHFKRKTRRKRNYTKIKDKLHERLVLTFIPPKGRRFGPEASERIAPTKIAGLTLRAVKVRPKVSSFSFASPTMVRVRGRGGWSNDRLISLIGNRAAMAAVIVSFRALAESGVTEAA